MGVWIETLSAFIIYNVFKSHPAWVCGLKHLDGDMPVDADLSHPAWVCGLKLIQQDLFRSPSVTPCVGVWIETLFRRNTQADGGGSHPAWGCGLKRL